MNIVKAGTTLQVYGEEIQTYDKIPLGTYDVCFNKMAGFFLSIRNDLETKEEKIYGTIDTKVAKVLKSFEESQRNFGVILSGQKGIGKSLFIKLLTEKANYPVVTVNDYIPGITNFLSSIEQEVIVVFDEFEKTFSKTDDCNPQDDMLSFFDGLDSGKKLFLITCNEVTKLNKYLIGRPGRFHYHFKLQNPTANEIAEYLNDKLFDEYKNIISNIQNLSTTAEVTYDVLRAIAFDVNQGYPLEEVLNDLNIDRSGRNNFIITITLSNGEVFEEKEHIDIFSSEDIRFRAYPVLTNIGKKRAVSNVWVSFKPSDIEIDNGEFTIDPAKVNYRLDYDDTLWNLDEKDKPAFEKAISKTTISNITIEKEKVFDYMKRFAY